MKDNTFQKMLEIRSRKGCGFVFLLDPDGFKINQVPEVVGTAREAGVDIFFIGGSLILRRDFDEFTAAVKKAAGECPVVLFPGNLQQISGNADAILFLSLISGRNPNHLIDTQVLAAPQIWQLGLEAISCAYMLVESGQTTSAEYMSHTRPMPRNKPAIAVAHSLAAQYLGFKLIYLEAGSGARLSVPDEMIHAVTQTVETPVIAGGGIRTPEEAARKAQAGASFVVIGNHFENRDNHALFKEFADAIHDVQKI